MTTIIKLVNLAKIAMTHDINIDYYGDTAILTCLTRSVVNPRVVYSIISKAIYNGDVEINKAGLSFFDEDFSIFSIRPYEATLAGELLDPAINRITVDVILEVIAKLTNGH